MTPVTALMRWVHDSKEMRPKYWNARPHLIIEEVTVSMGEYEERFRFPIQSLHQTFAATRGPHWERRRSRRFWVAAALVGVMTMTYTVASHHTIHRATHRATGNGSQVSEYSNPMNR